MKLFSTFITLIIVSIATVSNATSITFNGTVNKIFTYDGSTIDYVNSSNLFGNTFTIGDTYSGMFNYDINNASLIAISPTHAVYNHNTLSGITTTFNQSNYTFNSFGNVNDYGFVQIQNNQVHSGREKDAFNVSDRYYDVDSQLTHDAEFYLFDDTALVYHGLFLPNDVDLMDFNVSIYHQSFIDNTGNQLHVYGNIDSIGTPTPTPEPSTCMLVGFGMLSFSWLMRKKY